MLSVGDHVKTKFGPERAWVEVLSIDAERQVYVGRLLNYHVQDLRLGDEIVIPFYAPVYEVTRNGKEI